MEVVEQKPGTIRCTICDHDVPDAKYCVWCGSPLHPNSFVTPITRISVPMAEVLPVTFGNQILERVAREHGHVMYKSGKMGIRLENGPDYEHNTRQVFTAYLEQIGNHILALAKDMRGGITPKNIHSITSDLVRGKEK